jgi:hypothetical protein
MLPRAAVCRWCRNPIPNPSSGTCYANTRGCGETCGFRCGCTSADWTYGPHEPTELGYSITYEHGLPVFVLVDQDRRRAIEWRSNYEQPLEIIHNATPRTPGDKAMGCTIIPAVCFPVATPLQAALADLYRRAGESFDPEVHEQVHAAMWIRWALG